MQIHNNKNIFSASRLLPSFMALVFSIFFGNLSFSQDQNVQCGTVVSKEYYKEMREISSRLSRLRVQNYTPPCIDKTLSIVVHIVRDSLGNDNVNTSEIENELAILNTAFETICLRFTICKYEYIDNFQFDTLTADKEKQLRIQYDVKDVINWYFVEFFEHKPGSAGYAYLPGGPDNVFLRKQLYKGNTITHEMGHFFGLLHTFDPGAGATSSEYVDHSNCTTDGDGICDTDADPYLSLPSLSTPYFVNCEVLWSGKLV